MASTLVVKIIAAASAYAPLQALLGISPFRMSSFPLPQGSTFPAVLVQVISNPASYSVSRRMATSFARVQFTIFGAMPGGENSRSVEAALSSFLDQFSANGVAGLSQQPNYVINSREFGIAATSPETFQIVVDANIFNNELL